MDSYLFVILGNWYSVDDQYTAIYIKYDVLYILYVISIHIYTGSYNIYVSAMVYICDNIYKLLLDTEKCALIYYVYLCIYQFFPVRSIPILNFC